MSSRKGEKELLNESWVGHHNLRTEFTHNPSSQYNSIHWSSSDEETEKEEKKTSKLYCKLPLQRKIKPLGNAKGFLDRLQLGFDDFALVRDRVIAKEVCDPNRNNSSNVEEPEEEEEEQRVASPVLGSQIFSFAKRIKTVQGGDHKETKLERFPSPVLGGCVTQEHERSPSPVLSYMTQDCERTPVLRCMTQDYERSTSPVVRCVTQNCEGFSSPVLRCVPQEHVRTPLPALGCATEEHEKSLLPLLNSEKHQCEKSVSSSLDCVNHESRRSISPVIGCVKHEIERSTSPVLGNHKKRKTEVQRQSFFSNLQTDSYRSTNIGNREENDPIQDTCREDSINKDSESAIHRKVKSHLSTTFQRASSGTSRGLGEGKLNSSKTCPEKKGGLCNEEILYPTNIGECFPMHQKITNKNEHVTWVGDKESMCLGIKKGLEEARRNSGDSCTTVEPRHKTLSLSLIKEKLVTKEKMLIDNNTTVLVNVPFDQQYCEGESQVEAIDCCNTPEKIEEKDESITEITADTEIQEVKNELDQRCQSAVETGQKGSAWLWHLQQQTPEKRNKGSSDLNEPPDSTKKKFKKNGHAAKFRRLLQSWQSGIHMWQFQMAKAKKDCMSGSISHTPYCTPSSDLEVQPVVEVRETPKHSRNLFKVAEMKISSPSSTFSLPTKVMALQLPKRLGTSCMPAAFPVLSAGSEEEGREQLLQLKVIQVGGMLPMNGAVCVKYKSIEELPLKKNQKMYVLVLGLMENRWIAHPTVNEKIEIYAPWQQLNLPDCDTPVIFSNYYITENQSHDHSRPSSKQETDVCEQNLSVCNSSSKKQRHKRRIIIVSWVCPCCHETSHKKDTHH
ncbi:uncharacterized protein LOC143018988 isoform X2 [Oratosquilla oratoria]